MSRTAVIGMVILIGIVLVSIAIPLGLVNLQFKVNKKLREQPLSEEWSDQRLATLRLQDFVLCRALRESTWLGANYVFQNEARTPFAQFEGNSKYGGKLIVGEVSVDIFLQNWGSQFRGKVGAKSSSSIVFKKESQIIAEAESDLALVTNNSYNISIGDKKYQYITQGAFRDVFEEGTFFGRSINSKGRIGLGEKVLFAFNKDIPENVRAILLYLSILR